MGYPMTWQRIINRNGLGDGNYGTPPDRWARRVNITNRGLLSTDEEFYVLVFLSARERIEQYEGQASSLAGDLRRLEADTVDESQVCEVIARNTGVDVGHCGRCA